MRSFVFDNNLGVYFVIMEVLIWVNWDYVLGYGDDLWIEEVVWKIKEMFVVDCELLFVFNGIGSNVIVL